MALPYMLSQVRKPDRWLGRFIVWTMNLSHSDMTDWGLEHVQIGARLTILDVGCGGGRTIQKMAAMTPEGIVYGVDYADGSVAASHRQNESLIREGRVGIEQAAVSHLPFPDNFFDLVTAVETHYYWDNLVEDMQEIRRVLKPGATLVVMAESYKKSSGKDRSEWLERKLLKFKQLSVEEHFEMFTAAGFSEVKIFEEEKKGWLCGVGKKPLAITYDEALFH